MAVVNTNIGASLAQASLMKNERALGTAMEQLSTGKKINSAGDNAAGLAISSRMTSQIRGLDAAIRNANDAISMVNTAEGALDEITSMLQRMRELAVQAGTGTTAAADRTYLNSEFVALRNEIDRIADNTKWNGRNILDGSLRSVETEEHAVFGLQIPTQVEGVPANVLDPRNTWEDPAAYDEKALDLARRFRANDAKFDLSDAVRAAGPRVD